jgi:hypothetical protein
MLFSEKPDYITILVTDTLSTVSPLRGTLAQFNSFLLRFYFLIVLCGKAAIRRLASAEQLAHNRFKL